MSKLQLLRKQALEINPDDNIAVAIVDLSAGEEVSIAGKVLPLVSDVPIKHKFALRDFSVGDSVIMYGVLVGKASQPIRAGERISTENVHHQATGFHARTKSYSWKAPDVSRWKDRTFLGYLRGDGQVGTRNYWLVVPLVFCENRNIRVLQEAFEKGLGFAASDAYRLQVAELSKLYAQGKTEAIRGYQPDVAEDAPAHGRVFSNIDGVKFLTHEGGCGGTREDARLLCGLIAGYLHHPNVAGATILSLGCQNAQITMLREEIAKRTENLGKPLLILDQQQSQLESAMLSRAIHKTFLGLMEANKLERTPASLSHLTVGLKCGGSDGFSGITANPAIGHVSDLIAALGGKSVLAEFPELCGVEQNLIDRCVDDSLGDRFGQMMKAYAARAEAVGTGFDMNPSPGNIKDGLITDAMKSAGAVKKGGTSPVVD
ncbi:MAG: UxaA family hydrolase, partial [Acidobacteriaceae bacterium]